MTFTDAWLMWLLSMTQPNAPTANQPVTTSVTEVRATRTAPPSSSIQTVSTLGTASAPIVVTGQSGPVYTTRISNGY